MRIRAAHVLLSLLTASTACNTRGAQDEWPLAPLSADEIRSASELLRSRGLLNDSVTVLHLTLHEGSKDNRTGAPRTAEARLFDQRSELVTDVVMDIASGRVTSTTPRPGAIPPFTRFDIRTARELLRNDSAWNVGLERRGLEQSDVSLLYMGPGVLDSAAASSGHRFLRVLVSHERAPSAFVAPVEGLAALVDLTSRSVARVTDEEPVRFQLDSSPLYPKVLEPRGVNATHMSRTFQLGDNVVEWNGWRIHFALHPREGLVLYEVGFGARDSTPRSVLARASLAEMLVPYGDASGAWTFRNVFDVGEFGLGTTAMSLVRNHDVPGGAALVNAVLADERGEPRELRNVIGIYERDGGLRWRHAGRAERARELVLRSVATVGNYDYGFSWVFSQDGVIALEIDLTGMMQVKGVHHNDPRYGVQVSPGLSAIHHQHFFGFRFDFDIGSAANRIREVEVVLDSTKHPGTVFEWRSQVLASEADAARDASPQNSRFWIVEESFPRDTAAGPAGYVIMPGTLPRLLATEGSALHKRGAFATHQVWASVFKGDERYSSGEFPAQDTGSSGVVKFVGDSASLDGADLVVWYTAGLTHVPRPEEWPMMPVSRLRFELRPNNFVRTGTQTMRAHDQR